MKGELILTNLLQLKPGMEYAELPGYDGARTMVRLDPKRSPQRNAELYFKKYKKAKAGVPVIASRISGNIGMLGSRYRGYFVTADERALARVLTRAESDPLFLRALQGQVAARRPLVQPRRQLCTEAEVRFHEESDRGESGVIEQVRSHVVHYSNS